jgi:hypothetical protein
MKDGRSMRSPSRKGTIKLVYNEHKLLSNGLTHVATDGCHPILGLIVRAEQEWADKEGRFSKSLNEAVRDYKR